MLAMLLLNRMSAKRRLVKKQKTLVHKKASVDYCRTCLNTEDLVPIFYNKDTEEKRSGDLRLVTGLEIKINDGLSQKICTQCMDIMTTALQFRRTSKKAEKALLSMLTGTTAKRKISTSKITRNRLKSNDKEDYDIKYEAFEEDFQSNYEFDIDVKMEEVEPKIAEQPSAAKKKRMVIPNASSYKCSICEKEFRMKATFKAHMRFHTNYCVCELCGKRCRNNNQLQEHKRARHGLGKIHKCTYCEYSSATKEALTIHERRHTGERPYICDHCGATFHRRSNLVQHIAIHLPDKNFLCSICSKCEKSRKLLAIHKYKYHRLSRYRYICPVCRDTFTRPGNVRQHLIRSHKVCREDQGVIEKVEVQIPVSAEVLADMAVIIA